MPDTAATAQNGRCRCIGVAADVWFAAILTMAFLYGVNATPIAPLATAQPLISDNILIRCSPTLLGYRSSVLQFTRQVRLELERDIGLPPYSAPSPLELEIGVTDGNAITHELLRDSRGVWGLVRIGNPFESDPDELRVALTTVFLRTAIYGYARGSAKVTEPPPWLVRGMARQLVRDYRMPDFETAYTLWSRGRLAGVVELWSDSSPKAESQPAVAAQFVAWWMAQPQRREGWLTLCRHLGGGGEWNADELAHIFFGGDWSTMDEAWDLWMLARGSSILEAGATPPGVTRRFRASLLLYPWEYGMSMRRWINGRPLSDYLDGRAAMAARTALQRKAIGLRGAGAGRDPRFQGMAHRFADAIESAAAGRSAKAATLWQAAEAERRELEALAAAGVTLRVARLIEQAD